MAITLKICVFDPMLVKPKCVWEVYIYFENCKQTAENCKQTAENCKQIAEKSTEYKLNSWKDKIQCFSVSSK